jgi:ABC-type nitrate/sulfonate/bicarbonate transport system substrate-binding protein
MARIDDRQHAGEHLIGRAEEDGVLMEPEGNGDGLWTPNTPWTRRALIRRAAGSFAAVSGGGVLLSACGHDEAGPGGSSTPKTTAGGGSKKLTVVNILPPQLGYAAEYIADIDGHFKKEGLSVTVETARGSAPAIQAVLSGTALLSWVGWLESVIAIANRGAPIVAVGFTARRSTLAIVSDKNKPLAKPQDLRGKRIGIPSEGGTSETTLDLLLQSNGISPDDVPRQVTGFAPGTFELVKRGRIAGFVIGASQEQQFRETQPDATFLKTADYVTDGLTYITSKKGLDSNREIIASYMRALKAAMTQILNDDGFTDTIKKLRAKYDFDELKKDSIAQAYIKYISDSWVVDGKDKLLKNDPAKWKQTYDAAVKIKAAKGGVDVTKNVAPSFV